MRKVNTKAGWNVHLDCIDRLLGRSPKDKSLDIGSTIHFERFGWSLEPGHKNASGFMEMALTLRKIKFSVNTMSWGASSTLGSVIVREATLANLSEDHSVTVTFRSVPTCDQCHPTKFPVCGQRLGCAVCAAPPMKSGRNCEGTFGISTGSFPFGSIPSMSSSPIVSSLSGSKRRGKPASKR